MIPQQTKVSKPQTTNEMTVIGREEKEKKNPSTEHSRRLAAEEEDPEDNSTPPRSWAHHSRSHPALG